MQPQMMMGPGPGAKNNTRLVVGFLIVLVIHALGLYGLNAGLTDIIKEKLLGDIQTVEIEAPKEEEEKPPPPPPRVDVVPPPFVPPPEISIEMAPTENTTALVVTTTQRPPETPPPAPARKALSVPPKADARRGGITKPEYPPSVRRAGGEGTVYVQVLVLETGRVGDARIQTSSGHPKLDEAVVAEAKRSWRFTPGTEDGKAVQMWVTVPIVFKLTD
jgi:periplasmic protein TonB